MLYHIGNENLYVEIPLRLIKYVFNLERKVQRLVIVYFRIFMKTYYGFTLPSGHLRKRKVISLMEKYDLAKMHQF